MSKVYKGDGVWVDTPSVRPSRTEAVTTTDSNNTKTAQDNLGDNDVSKSAKKEYTNGENNILTGTASVTPNPKLRAKQTIEIGGIGKYLSGLYYVEKVTHTFDTSGYTQSLDVTKNGFVDGVKSKTPTNTAKPQPKEVTPKVATKEHTIKQGDTLWDLAVKYYGNGSRWVDIAKANSIDVNGGEAKISIGTKLTIPS